MTIKTNPSTISMKYLWTLHKCIPNSLSGEYINYRLCRCLYYTHPVLPNFDKHLWYLTRCTSTSFLLEYICHSLCRRFCPCPPSPRPGRCIAKRNQIVESLFFHRIGIGIRIVLHQLGIRFMMNHLRKIKGWQI